MGKRRKNISNQKNEKTDEGDKGNIDDNEKSVENEEEMSPEEEETDSEEESMETDGSEVDESMENLEDQSTLSFHENREGHPGDYMMLMELPLSFLRKPLEMGNKEPSKGKGKKPKPKKSKGNKKRANALINDPESQVNKRMRLDKNPWKFSFKPSEVVQILFKYALNCMDDPLPVEVIDRQHKDYLKFRYQLNRIFGRFTDIKVEPIDSITLTTQDLLNSIDKDMSVILEEANAREPDLMELARNLRQNLPISDLDLAFVVWTFSELEEGERSVLKFSSFINLFLRCNRIEEGELISKSDPSMFLELRRLMLGSKVSLREDWRKELLIKEKTLVEFLYKYIKKVDTIHSDEIELDAYQMDYFMDSLKFFFVELPHEPSAKTLSGIYKRVQFSKTLVKEFAVFFRWKTSSYPHLWKFEQSVFGRMDHFTSNSFKIIISLFFLLDPSTLHYPEGGLLDEKFKLFKNQSAESLCLEEFKEEIEEGELLGRYEPEPKQMLSDDMIIRFIYEWSIHQGIGDWNFAMSCEEIKDGSHFDTFYYTLEQIYEGLPDRSDIKTVTDICCKVRMKEDLQSLWSNLGRVLGDCGKYVEKKQPKLGKRDTEIVFVVFWLLDKSHTLSDFFQFCGQFFKFFGLRGHRNPKRQFSLSIPNLCDVMSAFYQENTNDYARVMTSLFSVHAEEGSDILSESSLKLKTIEEYRKEVLKRWKPKKLTQFLGDVKKKGCKKWDTKDILIGIILFDIESHGVPHAQLKKRWNSCVNRLHIIIKENKNKINYPVPNFVEKFHLKIPNREEGKVDENQEGEIAELIGIDFGIIDTDVDKDGEYSTFIKLHSKSNLSIGKNRGFAIYTVRWTNEIQENYASIKKKIPPGFFPLAYHLIKDEGGINLYHIEWKNANAKSSVVTNPNTDQK